MGKNEIIRWLREYDGRPVKIMEVCGTHTSALYKTGLRQILSPKIQLLSGPGCPVCVTPTAYIDKLVEISFRGGHRVLAFGDMLAVPGPPPAAPRPGVRRRAGGGGVPVHPPDGDTRWTAAA